MGGNARTVSCRKRSEAPSARRRNRFCSEHNAAHCAPQLGVAGMDRHLVVSVHCPINWREWGLLLRTEEDLLSGALLNSAQSTTRL